MRKSFPSPLAGIAPLAAAALLLSGVTPAKALVITTVYSNILTGYSGGFTAAGATQGTNTSFTTAYTTKTFADDITLDSYATGAITGFSFSVANFNTTATNARTIISIWDATGTSGGPGTLITAYNFSPNTYAANTVATFNYNAAGTTTIFTVPKTFWVGLTFDNANGATATSTALNNLGGVIYTTPTVGSSTDKFFISTGTGSATEYANNPAGTSNNYFGGSPTANFGFRFFGASNAPEPSSAALALPAAVFMAGGILRRRRRASH